MYIESRKFKNVPNQKLGKLRLIQEARKLRNSEARKLGNSEARKLGSSETRKLGNSEARKLGSSEVPSRPSYNLVIKHQSI